MYDLASGVGRSLIITSSALFPICTGKAVLSTYTPSDAIHQVLTSRLNSHIGSLVSSLLASLQSPSLRKSSLITISSALNSLGYSSIARQTFLNAREDLLRKRKRSIKFEGDTELYVAELSMVVFGMVRNTSEWFMVSWKETGMASGFVRWALSQIHSFALTFRRQVYGNVNVGSSTGGYDKATAARARAVALESGQQLKDVGLDFGFVLEELLRSEEEQMAMNVTRFEELPGDAAAAAAIATYDGLITDSPTSAGSAATSANARRPARAADRSPEPEVYTAPPVTNRRRAIDISASAVAAESAAGGAGPPGTPPRVRSLRQGHALPPAVKTMPIPSLTLTLADEASGISHRISSADLPKVTAQEIRRNSVMMTSMGTGMGMGNGSAAGMSSRGGLDTLEE